MGAEVIEVQAWEICVGDVVQVYDVRRTVKRVKQGGGVGARVWITFTDGLVIRPKEATKARVVRTREKG